MDSAHGETSIAKIEVRVPISASDRLFQRVKYLQRSLQGCGAMADARVSVSVGGDCEAYDIEEAQPWSRGTVCWRWVERTEYVRAGFLATGMHRFFDGTDADFVMFADNDVILARDLDDILESLHRTPAIAGVMAHAPPPLHHTCPNWEHIFTWAGLRPPQDLYEHSGWNIMFHDRARRLAPAYFNFGLVLVPGNWLPELSAAFRHHLDALMRSDLSAGNFNGQIALTLAIYQLGLPRLVLRPKYNYPNDMLFDPAYPEDLKDVRVLHYLRTNIINRDTELESPASIARLLGRTDLTGSNEVFRRVIERLYHAYGF